MWRSSLLPLLRRGAGSAAAARSGSSALLARARAPQAAAMTSAINASAASVRHNSEHRVMLLPEIPLDSAETNLMLKPYTDGLPVFKGVSERDCYFGLGKALLEFEAAVNQMEEACQAGETDFDKLFLPLERAKCQFENVWNSVNILHLTTDVIDKDRFHLLHRRAERAFNQKRNSRHIHKALLEVRARHARAVQAAPQAADAAKPGLVSQDGSQMETLKPLDPMRKRILDRYLLEYKMQGFELGEKKFLEMSTNWSKKLSESLRDYSFRITSATDRFRMTVRDPNVVRDFPIDVLKSMAVDSTQPSKGPWTLSLHPFIYRKFLEYCPDRKLRWNAYLANTSRGSRSRDVHVSVSPMIKGIRQQRLDQALTLGYNTYAQMAMETKMAASVDNANHLIDALMSRANDAQIRELQSLQAYAESRGFEESLALYDVEFFRRKQKESVLGLVDEDLRDFFPLPKVIKGLFRLCQNLYDIRFEDMDASNVKGGDAGGKKKAKQQRQQQQQQLEKEDTRIWHQDVQLFRVVDNSTNKVLGQFYLDPYIRDDKAYVGSDRGWYIPMRNASPIVESEALGAMLFSLPAPGYGKPSLLNFAEVQEIFRCFGNMLIHLLSKNQWSDLNGKTGIETDALDVSEHFMSHWLYLPEVLTGLSGHWSSNEPLSNEVVTALSQSRNHMAGYDLCLELFKASYDLEFYTEDYDNENYLGLAKRLWPQFMSLPLEKDDMFPMQFREIFDGELPASYYSGVWSRMLAADAFSAVKEVGLDNKEEVQKVARRFRDTFLTLGSSASAGDIFRQFRGRDPTPEALLNSLGLKGGKKAKSAKDAAASEEEATTS